MGKPEPVTQPSGLDKRLQSYYHDRIQQSWQGAHLLKGRAPTESATLLSSNDYLSVAKHPLIINAQIEALMESGNGLMMSAVFHNDGNPQNVFERAMADFLQAEDALIAQSGWNANTGLMQSIADADTPVYIDMMAHASLWEGIVSAGAKPVPFSHNNPLSLLRMLKKFGPGVIAVDSVYSTTGSVCPLEDIAALSTQYGCLLVVDESHSLGTHGPCGAGMVVEKNLSAQVDFITASLAKGFAGRGGIIVGSHKHIEYMRYEARPTIFSSAVLPHDIAGFNATLEVIQKESWRREQCHEHADYLRKHLLALGYNVSNSQSQIMALQAGKEQNTLILRDALEERDVFGAVFCAPATPKEGSLIRFSVCADLTQSDLDHVIQACKEIRSQVQLDTWPSSKKLKQDALRS